MGWQINIKFLKEISNTTTENKALATTETVHPAFTASTDGKYSNGVYIEEKQLREMKDDIKIYKNIYQSYEKQGKSTKRKMENFKYFLKVVNEDVL